MLHGSDSDVVWLQVWRRLLLGLAGSNTLACTTGVNCHRLRAQCAPRRPSAHLPRNRLLLPCSETLASSSPTSLIPARCVLPVWLHCFGCAGAVLMQAADLHAVSCTPGCCTPAWNPYSEGPHAQEGTVGGHKDNCRLTCAAASSAGGARARVPGPRPGLPARLLLRLQGGLTFSSTQLAGTRCSSLHLPVDAGATGAATPLQSGACHSAQAEVLLLCLQADKRFQLADWRARPLNDQMLAYARADTHYLLYCYDKLKVGCCARWLRSFGCAHCKEGALIARKVQPQGGALQHPTGVGCTIAASCPAQHDTPRNCRCAGGAEGAGQQGARAPESGAAPGSRGCQAGHRQRRAGDRAGAQPQASGCTQAEPCGRACLCRCLGCFRLRVADCSCQTPNLVSNLTSPRAASLSPTKQAVLAAVRERDFHCHCLHGAVQQVERHAER